MAGSGERRQLAGRGLGTSLALFVSLPPLVGAATVDTARTQSGVDDLALASERSAVEQAAQRAIERGLAYLARRQAETADGSFPRGSDGETKQWAPVGVAALGALAFMASGNTPGRGPQGRELERVIDYLLGLADMAPGADTHGYISQLGDRVSQTHGHGYATLVLAEAYGMSPRRSERLGRVLTAAVRLIERSQGTEGGWEYEPTVSVNHEGSITICYAQALRAARNSGIAVEGEVIARAEDYVLRLQKKDGSFRYQLDHDRSTVALTAAAITTLNMAGRYDGTAVQSGIDAIWTRLALGRDREPPHCPFYERLYLAQAFWQLSDTVHFERWFGEERERLVRTQEDDGSWRDDRYGDCYATAMNCLTLALNEGVLPIFQR